MDSSLIEMKHPLSPRPNTLARQCGYTRPWMHTTTLRDKRDHFILELAPRDVSGFDVKQSKGDSWTSSTLFRGFSDQLEREREEEERTTALRKNDPWRERFYGCRLLAAAGSG